MTPTWQALRRRERARPHGQRQADIVKIGLATIREGRILLVRKQDGPSFILPGGKPRKCETDAQTLEREIAEELSCEIVGDSLRLVGEFEDDAADLPGRRVKVRLYRGELRGAVSISSEIVEARWWDEERDDPQLLAASLRRQILPALHGDRADRRELPATEAVRPHPGLGSRRVF
jgi:8-oxo-dGTP diphosphatase